jgi:hypothetical protein
VTHSEVNIIIQNRAEGRVNQIIGRTIMEKMEKIQLIESSSPYESNRASPTGGRRPLPFKRDLMGLSLSLSLPMTDIMTLQNTDPSSSDILYLVSSGSSIERDSP